MDRNIQTKKPTPFLTGAATASLTVAGSAASDKLAPVPSKTLFVSGLNKRTTSEKLNEEFAKFGEVVHGNWGFGLVKYATLDDAAKGIEGMDAQFLDGWVIFAEYARPRPPLGQAGPQEPYAQRR